MGKRALIFGISGQDGAYLAQLLLSKGYHLFGVSRDIRQASFERLASLGILANVELLSADMLDFRSLFQVLLHAAPDEIYNLAGQSSVGLSFERPVETFASISVATLNLLEAIRLYKKEVRLFNAGSGDCFGHTPHPVTETSLFAPVSPYAFAKAQSFWFVKHYRQHYKMFVTTGLLFNHESPFRGSQFVTQKIMASILRIHKGGHEKLQLGNINIMRDWGWASEYVEAMWKMLQAEKPDDYIIATGESYTLKELLQTAFEYRGLHWQDHVVINEEFIRPTDIPCVYANPQKAWEELGWKAQYKMKDIVHLLLAEGEKKSGFIAR